MYQWVNTLLAVLTSFFMNALLLLLIWTLEAQFSVPMWVSVSISIYRQMKVPSGLTFLLTFSLLLLQI